MTVAAQTPSIEYVEDGSTTAFPVPFRYDSPQHIEALRRAADGTETELVYGTDYSVSAGSGDAGGTLTATAAATSGTLLVIRRVTPRVQPTDYETLGKFTADSHERGLDRPMLVDQEQDAELARAIKTPRGEEGMQLPGLAQRIGALLGFDETGAQLKAFAIAALAPGLIGALVPLLDESYRGPPGAPGGNYYSSINAAAHGAQANVDSSTASAANAAAIQAAVDSAAGALVDVFLPSGTYWFDAANSTASGLHLNIPDGKIVRIIGETGTVIKRRATATMASTSALVFVKGNTGISVSFHNIVFDGNEANCPFDAGNLYEHEQSANVKLLPGTGTPLFLGFFDCDVGKNRVGDGYHANVRVDHFMAIGCRTLDTSVRRVRSDWQFSRYATYATIMNTIDCNSWESEPADTQATARVFLNNLYAASVFDLAGDTTGATRRLLPVYGSNIRCDADPARAGLPFCNFWRVKGELVNCHFRLVDRIQRCKIHFRGGAFQVADNGGGAADAVQHWPDQVMETAGYESYEDRLGNYAIFEGLKFLKDATVATGNYVTISTTASQANAANQIAAGAPLVRTAIIDCDVPERLDHVAIGVRAGKVEIRGGSLRAATAIYQFTNDGDYLHRLTMRGDALWSAPAWVSLPFAIVVTTGASELNLSGACDGDTTQLVSSAAIGTAPSVKWRVDAVAHVAANPEGALKGIPGLVAKVRNPKRGAPFAYRASYSTGDETGYGGTSWAMLDHAPAKGATADRPTLAANDAGVQFFDTTLDADGKPIWWAGATWVDATGAAA